MANQPFLAIIIGIPHIPTVTEVNVRTAPGTTQPLAFKSGLQVTTTVQEVQPDLDGKNMNGKVYQWFKILFPNGQSGWIRDDLIEVVGDGTRFGYGILAQRILAFNLRRQAVPAAPVPTQPPTPAPFSQPSTPTQPPAPAPFSQPSTSTQPPAPAPFSQPTTSTQPPAPAPFSQPTTPTQPPAPAPVQQPAPVNGSASGSGYFTIGGFPGQPLVPGKAYAVGMAKTGANMRPGPGPANNPPVGKLPYNARAELLELRPEDTGNPRFRWVRLNFNGTVGWVREDFVRFDGDFEAVGASKRDMYPAPLANTWWVRDFNLDPAVQGEYVHLGWDLAGNQGEPIYAGPRGGTVIKTFRCAKCTPDRPSTLMQGLGIGDQSVFSDPGWGFGYGHYIIVRYNNDLLPASTRQFLASKNLNGGHMFVMYAHLFTIDCSDGQTVSPNQRIASMGNTGNSEAAHLHLEVRASVNPNDEWARMRPNLFTPGVLFLR